MHATKRDLSSNTFRQDHSTFSKFSGYSEVNSRTARQIPRVSRVLSMIYIYRYARSYLHCYLYQLPGLLLFIISHKKSTFIKYWEKIVNYGKHEVNEKWFHLQERLGKGFERKFPESDSGYEF